MRHRPLLTGVAVALAALPAAHAHADPPATVEVSVQTVTVLSGDGTRTVVLCRAVAAGTEPEVVAVATEVECSVDGVSHRAAAPGPLAVTVRSFAGVPLTVCVAGRAAFVDAATNDVFSVAATPICVPAGRPLEER